MVTEEIKVNTKKPKSKKKIIIWTIVALLAVVVAIAIGFLIKVMNFGFYGVPVYESKDEVYAYFDEEPHAEPCYNLDRYSSKLKRLNGSVNKTNDQLVERVKEKEELSEQYQAVVNEINTTIINCFAEEYGVNVEEELSKLKVYTVDAQGTTISIGGFYMRDMEGFDNHSIYIDNELLLASESEGYDEDTDSCNSFYGTYIHETMHYLGAVLKYEDETHDEYVGHITEGLADATTTAVFKYGNYGIYNSSYGYAQALVEQILIADKDFVAFMFEGEDVREYKEVAEYFNEKTADGFGENLLRSIELIALEDYSNMYNNNNHIIIPQHFVGECLKYFDLTEEEQIEAADLFIAPISKLEK